MCDAHYLEPGIPRCVFFEDLAAAIRRAVIDGDQFKFRCGLSESAFERLYEESLAVIYRHYHRHAAVLHIHVSRK